MLIIHFLVGRPKAESSNGIVKAVYYLSREESRLEEVITWAISKHVGSIVSDHYKYPTHITIPNCIMILSKYFYSEITKLKNNHNVIFHLHGTFNWQNWLIAKLLSKNLIPYVVSPHGGLIVQSLSKHKIKKMCSMPFTSSYITKAKAIRALTGQEKNEILNRFPNKNIFVAPNGVLHQNNTGESVFRGNIEHFVYIGRIDVFHKGLDILIRGFRLLLNRGINARLTLVGPDYKNSLIKVKNLISFHNLRDFITMLPPKYGYEKEQLIKNAYYFVQTSRAEGLPIGILEAMALGTPVVITKCIDPLGVVDKYRCGYLVDPDPESIANGLMIAYQTPLSLRNAQGVQAKNAIKKDFTWSKIAEEMIAQYKVIIST